MTRTAFAALALLSSLAAVPAQAQEQVLNLYSARHYSTDEALYDNFTKTTDAKASKNAQEG